MTKLFTVLPVCAALACAVPMAAFAQTSTETTTDTTTEQATETTPSSDTTTEQATETAPSSDTAATSETGSLANELPMGEDADKDPQLGQPYNAETIGAWDMRCVKTEQETDPCQMYQLLDDGENNPVAEVSLFRLPPGGKAVAGATIVVPLETALPNQLTIAVDGGNARRYPYAFCNPVGCYARLGLTVEDVAAFKRGREAKVTIVPALAPDQTVVLTLSLEGFTASYDKASVIEQ